MISRLKPYPKYTDTGILWLNSIPSHWRLAPNRALLKRRKVLVGELHQNYKLLSLTKLGVIIRDVESGKGKFSSDMGTSQVVKKGDLVFCLFDVPETPRTVGLSPHDGMITGAYSVFECLNPNDGEYLNLFYCAMDDRKLLSPLYSGLRNTIPRDRFLGIKTPQPPAEEQEAIVRFLKWANSRLERAIRAKRKTIALLNEQKQAIIHRAVTRGLNSNAPMKSSGNPWLGNIPKHWGQQAMWTLSRLRVERNPGGLSLLSVFLDRGVIRYEDGGGQVHAPSLDLSNYQVVHRGDFVLNNQQAWRGSVGVSQHNGIISPAYIVLKLSSQLDAHYANYLMRSRSMVDQFVAASKGVGDIQRQVFWPFLRMVQVPLPKMEEQRSIVDFLDAETREIDSAIDRFGKQISLLHEYKARLTADVVAGKLDVREAAKNIPNEVLAEEAVPTDTAEEEPEIEESAI